VVGRETRDQAAERKLDVKAMIACVGGGSNAIGFFAPFLDQPTPRLVGVEAGGRGFSPGDHAARMRGRGRPGIVHGYKSLFLLDEDGQVQPTHSVSAGLDYPGIGPQLAHLGTEGRIDFTTASDEEALDAVRFFARQEGLMFALESAHAGAAARRLAPEYGKDEAIIVNMSGRGDKDLFILAPRLDRGPWVDFLSHEVAAHSRAGKTGEKP
jgi:tryptophan synthase beta chain